MIMYYRKLFGLLCLLGLFSPHALAIDGEFTGEITGEMQYYSLTMTSQEIITIKLNVEGLSEEAHAYFTVHDGQGNRKVWGAGPKGLNSYATNTFILAPGYYEVGVGTSRGERGGTGTYVFSADFGTLAKLSGPVILEGELTGSHQLYELTVTDAKDVTLSATITELSQEDRAYIVIFDSQGRVKGSTNGGSSSVSSTATKTIGLAAGSYTVAVSAMEGALGKYSLSSTLGTITKKTDSVQLGELTGAQQLHEFTLPSSHSVYLSLGINELNQADQAHFDVYDSQGRMQVYSSGSGVTGVNSYAYKHRSLPAGSYIIGVKAKKGATGKYSLSANAGTLTKKTDPVQFGELTGSQQLYELTVSSGQYVTVSAGINELSQEDRAYLDIYDSQGNLKGDGFGQTGINSLAEEGVNLEAGSYVVAVRAKEGGRGKYSLSSTMGTLTKKTDAVHQGELTGAQQLYELTVSSGQYVTLSAGINELSKADKAYIEIYDSQGNRDAYASGVSGVTSYVEKKRYLAAGTYTVVVTASGGATGKYSLSSTVGELSEMPLSQVSGSWAPSLGRTFSSVKANRYSFESNGNRVISLSVASQGNSSSNTIYILNSQKQIVVEQRGTRTGLIYEGTLTSGAYEIIVTTANVGDSGTFVLSSNYVNFNKIEPSVSAGAWTQSGGMDYTSVGNQIKQIEVAGGVQTIIGVEAGSVQPYIFLLDSFGQKVAQSGVVYDPTLAEISTELPAGTYYVVAATAVTGVAGNFDVKLIGGQFSEFVPQFVALDVAGIASSQDAVDVTIYFPMPFLDVDIRNVVFSYVVNGVSTTVDLAALGCTIGEPCTISIDTQDLDVNSSINWRVTAEIQEDGVWVNSEVANAHTLVNLDLLVLDDFKTDTYYVPVTVKLLDPVLHTEYENFRLKYLYLKHPSSYVFEEVEQPITALTNQEQIFTIDGSVISKLESDYEDSAKLFVQVIADKKANGGNAAVNDVILDSSEKTYDTQPVIKLREALSTDGVFRFSALIPHSLRYAEIYYTRENENTEHIQFDAVAGPELVDYEINLGNAGRLDIGLKGLSWPRNWFGNNVLATVNVIVPPEFTLTATNRDGAVIQNGTVAKAKWNAETALESYCADPSCLIKLQYRMLDDSGVATPWKSYLLDERHETMSYIGTEREVGKGTGSESLWFDNIGSGIVEAKLVAQYTMPGETEVTTSIIVEGSVVVAPTTTFIAPNNTQLPDVPTEWLYSINPQSSTDTQYDVSMNWPVANYDTFTVEQFIDGSWQLLYNGSVNAWSGTMSNLAQAGEVKLKLTSCQGGTCNETLKDITVNGDVTFKALTTETSDVFEFDWEWVIDSAESDFVRIFYTEDESLFDSAVDQGWQELSYGSGMPTAKGHDGYNVGKGYLRHSPDVMKAAVRVFVCANSGYCFTPPKTNIVHFPLAPVIASYVKKTASFFAVYGKPYRDGDYVYEFEVEANYSGTSVVYPERTDAFMFVRLSDLVDTDLPYDLQVFAVVSRAKKVDVSASYGDPAYSIKRVTYLSGEATRASATITSSPGCHQSNPLCAAKLVDPFNPGVVTGTFSHPKGIKWATVYIENTDTGVKKGLIANIVKSATEWQFTANIADTGALEPGRRYKIYIEGVYGASAIVASEYYYVTGDTSAITGPTSISVTGDASAIDFSWNTDVEQNSYFSGYSTTSYYSISGSSSYTLNSPNDSGTFGVRACYVFDEITDASTYQCNSYIYVAYALENGAAVCVGSLCQGGETLPSQSINIHTELLGAPLVSISNGGAF